MRKKRLFLTLAVVMLLAVLTISASAEEPIEVSTGVKLAEALWTGATIGDTADSNKDYTWSVSDTAINIKLTADITITMSDNSHSKSTKIPFVSDTNRQTIYVPVGTRIDLNGHTLTMANLRIYYAEGSAVAEDQTAPLFTNGSIRYGGGNSDNISWAMNGFGSILPDDCLTDIYTVSANAFAHSKYIEFTFPKGVNIHLNHYLTTTIIGQYNPAAQERVFIVPDKDLITVSEGNSNDLSQTSETVYMAYPVENASDFDVELDDFYDIFALVEDVELSEDLELTEDTLLDLNGHTLTGGSICTNGYTLTLYGLTATNIPDISATDNKCVLGVKDASGWEAAVKYSNAHTGVVGTIKLLTTINLDNNTTAGAPKAAYTPFQTGQFAQKIALTAPAKIDMNGFEARTDNATLAGTAFINSRPTSGGLNLGCRSGNKIVSNVNELTATNSTAAIKEIRILSTDMATEPRTAAIVVPENVVLCGKNNTGTAVSRSPVMTTSITLKPGATISTSNVKNLVLQNGLTYECVTTADLKRAVPVLLETTTYSSGTMTQTGGDTTPKYVIYNNTDDKFTLTENVDISKGEVSLATNAVLDLAGKILTCKSIEANSGKVIDTVGGGKLILTNSIANSISPDNNGYLPLFDGEGYQFFQYSVIQRTTPALLNGELLNCMFRFEFADADAYALLAAGNSGLTLNFVVNFDDGSNPYRFSEKTLQAYGQAYVDSPGGHFAISVKLEGYAESVNFSTEFSLQTEAGATASAAPAESQSVIG